MADTIMTEVVIALTVLCSIILTFVAIIVTLLVCMKTGKYRNIDDAEAEDEYGSKHEHLTSRYPTLPREAWTPEDDSRFAFAREKTLIKVVVNSQRDANSHQSYPDDGLPTVVA